LNALSLGNVSQDEIWNELASGKSIISPLDWDAWNTNQTEIWSAGNNPNGEHFKVGTLGFGPYDFNNIGDKVRIVACYAVGSMGWDKAVEIGRQWKDRTISKTEKNIWLRSGRDSLFNKISDVAETFTDINGDFSLEKGASIIGNTPEAPGLTLNSAVGGIDISWNDVGAITYRIYRKTQAEFYLENPVSETYELIQEVDGSLFNYRDTEIQPGKNYWYSITAVDENGKESSKFLSRTEPILTNNPNTPSTDPTRGSLSPYAVPPKVLDEIYVVPNPYNIKSGRLYASRGVPEGTLTFVGLPAECRIRIYTQSGNLVANIQHSNTFPPNSTEQWDMLSDASQFIASGLYVFTVDQAKDENGNNLNASKVGKFVVIR
jgi:hypothetical protein